MDSEDSLYKGFQIVFKWLSSVFCDLFLLSGESEVDIRVRATLF